MDVLVDTAIWSLVLRRTQPTDLEIVNELNTLIEQSHVRIIGAIRQEVLSGIRQQQQFEKLKKRLGSFPDLEVTSEDYERAAMMFNQCRKNGIQGSNTDFLICAVAERYQLAIFTTDKDFTRYQTQFPIQLHTLANQSTAG